MDVTREWEISLIELHYRGVKKFKVTRRFPEVLLSETKVFNTKKEAKDQVDEWLE